MAVEKKREMFLSMFERRDIVDFVKEVEKHPCLYDNTLPSNFNRALTNQAWTDIAKVAASTVNDCKEKWRKIRIAFARSLKQGRSSNPPSRPYYLAEHLQFLIPFIKFNEHDTNPNSPDPASEDDPDMNEPIALKQEIDSNENLNGHAVFIEEPFEKRTKRDSNDSNRQTIPSKRSCLDSVERNPRKLFLMSIIPEVESFSDAEMRLFRRDIIDSIDKVFKTRENLSSDLN